MITVFILDWNNSVRSSIEDMRLKKGQGNAEGISVLPHFRTRPRLKWWKQPIVNQKNIEPVGGVCCKKRLGQRMVGLQPKKQEGGDW